MNRALQLDYPQRTVPRARSLPNPLYVLVLLSGVAFSVTACAYVVTSYLAIRVPIAPEEDPSGAQHFKARARESHYAGLLRIVDRCGVELMLAELAVLAIATVGTIGTDRYFGSSRRGHDGARARPAPGSQAPSIEPR